MRATTPRIAVAVGLLVSIAQGPYAGAQSLETQPAGSASSTEAPPQSPSTAAWLSRVAWDATAFDDAAELVGTLPGAWFARAFRGGDAPVVRGLAAQRSLYLLDGFDVNLRSRAPEAMDALSLLDPLLLASADLGSDPTRAGEGALGSVVRLRTRPPPTRRGLHVRLGGMGAAADWGTALAARATLGTQRVSGWMAGAWRRHASLRTGGGENLPSSDFATGHWAARGAVRLGSAWTAEAAYLGATLPRTWRTGLASVTGTERIELGDHLVWARLAAERPGATLERVELALGYHASSRVVERYHCSEGDEGACLARSAEAIERATRHALRADVLQVHMRARWAWLARRLVVEAGLTGRAEFARDDAQRAPQGGVAAWSPDAATAILPDGARSMRGGGFVRGRAHLARLGPSTALGIRAGARVDYALAKAEARASGPALDARHTPWTTSAGLSLTDEHWGGVDLLYAHVVSAPSLYELAAHDDRLDASVVPNPTLASQTADRGELRASLRHGGIRVEAAAFLTRIRHFVALAPASDAAGVDAAGRAPVATYADVGTARLGGVEAAVAFELGAGFGFSGQVTWQRGDVASPGASSTPAPGIPPLHGRVQLRWQSGDGQWLFSLGTRFADAQRRLGSADRANPVLCGKSALGSDAGGRCDGIDGWATIDGVAQWRHHGWLVRLAVSNAFDSRYRRYGSTFDEPGTDARLWVRFDWP